MTRSYALIATALAIGILAGLAGWTLRGLSARAEVAVVQLQLEAERTAREADRAQAMADGLRRSHQVQEAIDAEYLRSQQLQAAVRRADAVAGRLRVELEETRAWLSIVDPSDPSRSEAAAEAGRVLTELLGRCSEERRTIAEYADRAASAGQACVDAWPRP